MILSLIDQCVQHLSSLRFKEQFLNKSHEKALAQITQSLEAIVNEIYPRKPDQNGPFDKKSVPSVAQKNGSKNSQQQQAQQQQKQQMGKSQINQQQPNRQDDQDQKRNVLFSTMPQLKPQAIGSIIIINDEDDQKSNMSVIGTQQISQKQQQQPTLVQTQQPKQQIKKSQLDMYFTYENVVDQEYQQLCGSRIMQLCDICDNQLFDMQERTMVIQLDCGHYFHKECKEEFLEKNKLLECLICFKNRNKQKANQSSNPSQKSQVNQQQINLQQSIQILSQSKQKNKLDENNIPHKKLFQQDCMTQKKKMIDCSICLNPLFDKNHQEYIIQTECLHYFHLACLEPCFKDKFLQCPNCKAQYGVLIGDQPPGTMDIRLTQKTCSGYTCGSIEIVYTIYDSVKNNIKIPGTQRAAYLPDNQEGNYLVKLLKIAFDRKLIFTVGRSVTTGFDNQVVWNGIHHKTSVGGGAQNFGYPDPTYFTRVQQELADKGIK